LTCSELSSLFHLSCSCRGFISLTVREPLSTDQVHTLPSAHLRHQAGLRASVHLAASSNRDPTLAIYPHQFVPSSPSQPLIGRHRFQSNRSRPNGKLSRTPYSTSFWLSPLHPWRASSCAKPTNFLGSPLFSLSRPKPLSHPLQWPLNQCLNETQER
jgi:hypothetical protein